MAVLHADTLVDFRSGIRKHGGDIKENGKIIYQYDECPPNEK